MVIPPSEEDITVYEAIKEAYRSGRKDGIREYSWMLDGVSYVGTTGRTLLKALEEVDSEER